MSVQPRMQRRITRFVPLILLLASTSAGAQLAPAGTDPPEPGRFDMGRMWTFEYAPAAYFSETYKFNADDDWFRRARLSVLRIPGCSASFVSAAGLVVTNHHCVRNAIVQVTQPGETLLDSGFVAMNRAEERRIPNYTADQLIAVQDVSDEMFAAIDAATDDDERLRVRRETTARIEQRLRQQHADGHTILVQVIALYHGGRYSAYVFRRFTDVRLVAAAELQTGYFGGDPDNFTYPRYALDFAFLRVYDDQGRPHTPEHHFAWGAAGVEEDDVVFVIGNPGPTNRLSTISQLEFFRDVMLPAQIAFLTTRLDALWSAYNADPARGEQLGLRNRAFSLSNTLKATAGRLDALQQPQIMARRAAAERQFQDSLQARPELQQRYGDVLRRMAAVQQRKRDLGADYAAFLQYGGVNWPASLRRAIAVAELDAARRGGASADTLAAMTRRLGGIADNTPQLERDFLVAQFSDFQRSLGAADTIVRSALRDGTAADAAAAALRSTRLADSASVARALADGTSLQDDPLVRLAGVLAPRQAEFAATFTRLAAEEAELRASLGRARFEIFGTAMPPDATSSPRITDGVVRSYEYNGTVAPPYTTFYGMYDRFRSFGAGTAWDLPARWSTPPAGLDLGTPLNFVSTADTYGGNSGSPAVTARLEIVGLNFDRNIQGLSRDYIFLPERGRNVMVDVRAIGAALRHVYGGHHILEEISAGGER